jgi:hypothetical protein
VNVSSLLLPAEVHGNVEVTGGGVVPLSRAWAWADGQRPLLEQDDPDGVALADFYEYGRPGGSSVAAMLGLLETREGRRRFAKRVEGLPEWTVERSGDDVVRIVRPSARGPVVLWPIDGVDADDADG